MGTRVPATWLLLLVFYILRECGADISTALIPYNPIVGNYNSFGQYWCQGAYLPCHTNGECCSGCCQDAVGLCSSRNSDCFGGENPCNSIWCPQTTSCAVLPDGQPYCVPTYDFPTYPILCNPECPSGFNCKIFTNVNPPYGKCVIDDPCQGLLCQPGTICWYIPGVSSWPSQCIPDPCASTICPPGFACRVKPNAHPARAECVRTGPCAVIRCLSWYVCEDIPGSYPPQGRCVPSLSNPCMDIQCKAGSDCTVNLNTFPPRAGCVVRQPQITCASVTCRTGYTCVMEFNSQNGPPQPFSSPFSSPRPQCEPMHPCAYPRNPCLAIEICLERQVLCFDKVPCPLKAECYSRNPCANTICGRGYTCQLVETYCDQPPCYPLAQCVLTNPCMSEVNPCKYNEICTEIDVQCLVAPCTRVARCIPKFW